jgi:hypothetical protein
MCLTNEYYSGSRDDGPVFNARCVNYDSSSDNKPLSGGAIAGIVFCQLFLMLAAGVLAYHYGGGGGREIIAKAEQHPDTVL